MQHLTSKTPLVVRIAELAAIAAALCVAHWSYPIGTTTDLTIAGLSAALVYLLASELTGTTSDHRLRPFVVEARKVFLAWGLTLCTLLGVSWSLKYTAVYSRMEMGLWACFGSVFLLLVRWAARTALWRHCNGRHVRKAVLVGGGDLGRQWIETVRRYPELGVGIVAVFDDDPEKAGDLCAGIPISGPCDRAVDYVGRECVPMVFFALPLRAENRLRELVTMFSSSPANLYILPDVFTYELMNLNAFQVGTTPVIALSSAMASEYHNVVKRIEDIALGLTALVIALPIMAGIALGIALTSPGPVFFRQWRYGLDGTKILVWKFRTMSVCEDGAECIQAGRHDCRVTPFGSMLRRTSLDELPQLFNVLLGTMSLVGPRPHPIALDEYYRGRLDRYMWRLKIKPGMTGWAQVHGWRGETDTIDKMRKRMEHDLYYIENWSPWLDVRILWLTIWRGFIHSNAY